MAFQIFTLHQGDLMIPTGHGISVREPVHSWLVTDGSSHLLVDSGMPPAAEVFRKWNIEGTGGGPEAMRRTLREIGLSPDDVATVVLSHLHFDHAWNLELFPRARVLVQRDELFHAIDPVPTQRLYYTRQTYLSVLDRKRPSELTLLDGDGTVVDGVSVLKVPGHTPGMLVVIVETDRGRVALVSDLGDNYGCWYPDDPRAVDFPLRFLRGSFRPGAIRSESEVIYLASMSRVMKEADIVVPAHDARIPTRIPEQWFAVPDSGASSVGSAGA